MIEMDNRQTAETEEFFSVVIPLYNKKDYIEECLLSVTAQTFPHFRLYVIDDGSIDGSSQVAQSIKDHRITVISQANAGAAVARNRGASIARGDWIAFLDADDYWFPDHLQALRQLTQRAPAAAMVGNSYLPLTTALTPEARKRQRLPENPARTTNDFFSDFGRGLYRTTTSSIAVRRDVLNDIGGFANHKMGEDYEVWVRIALHHEVLLSASTTVCYRVLTPGSLTSHSQQSLRVNDHDRDPMQVPCLRVIQDNVRLNDYPADTPIRKFIAWRLQVGVLVRLRSGGWRKSLQYMLSDAYKQYGPGFIFIFLQIGKKLLSWVAGKALRLALRPNSATTGKL